MPLAQRLRRQLQRWTPCHRGPLPLDVPGRRILLPPTGFGLFYAALVVVMVLGALNYGNNPALLLALLLAASGLASVLMAQLQLGGLRLLALSAEPLQAGQPLQVQLQVQAIDGRRHHGIRACWDDQDPVTLQDIGNGMLQATLPLPTQHRGLLTVPPLRLATAWPLGLVTASIRLQPPVQLLVHPRPQAGAPPLPSPDDPAGKQPHSDAEISHLRDYRPGDARAQVAWKASARRGQLLVRQHQGGQTPVARLDWDQLPHLGTEARISRLAWWVIDAQRQQRRFSLHLPGQPVIGPDSGPTHVQHCLTALALLPGQALS